VSELSIEVVNLTRLALEPGEVALLVAGVLADEGLTAGELGVSFVGARRMRGLNRDFLGHDEVTDVLSFPLEDGDEPPAAAPVAAPASGVEGSAGAAEDAAVVPRLLGDVVVCPTRAAAQARGAGIPLAREIATLLVHGTLHVLGYDHETDHGEMSARQDELLGASSWERLLAQD
jgi:probable rRNA maturation factor